MSGASSATSVTRPQVGMVLLCGMDDISASFPFCIVNYMPFIVLICMNCGTGIFLQFFIPPIVNMVPPMRGASVIKKKHYLFFIWTLNKTVWSIDFSNKQKTKTLSDYYRRSHDTKR